MQTVDDVARRAWRMSPRRSTWWRVAHWSGQQYALGTQHKGRDQVIPLLYQSCYCCLHRFLAHHRYLVHLPPPCQPYPQSQGQLASTLLIRNQSAITTVSLSGSFSLFSSCRTGCGIRWTLLKVADSANDIDAGRDPSSRLRCIVAGAQCVNISGEQNSLKSKLLSSFSIASYGLPGAVGMGWPLAGGKTLSSALESR